MSSNVLFFRRIILSYFDVRVGEHDEVVGDR